MMTGVRKRSRVARLRKSVKAISPTIAVLLMIAIAVVASLVVYLWMMGFLNFTTANSGRAIQIQSTYYTGPDQGSYLGVYVQNVGQGKVTFIASQCLYVGGALQGSANVIDPEKDTGYATYALQESNIVQIVDQINLALGQTYKIKVVTAEGTHIEEYFTINTFTGQAPYSLKVSVVGQGSVSENNTGPYNLGDVVQLTATPANGWAFSAWSGDASGSTNPTTIVINGINTVTATFTLSSSQSTVKLSVSAPSYPTAGTPFDVTVTAQDASGNTVAGYVGTVHFTTSDLGSGVVLPGDYTFVPSDNGVHSFIGGVALVTAGSQSVTATDTVTSSITGSASVVVGAGSAVSLSVSAPSSVTVGDAFSVTVTAQDAYGNTAIGYTGTVHFTSSDGAAVLPADSVLSSGAGAFSVTLKTVGTQSVIATDTVTGSISGSASVAVYAGSAVSFALAGYPMSVTAGNSFSITVTAVDQYGYVAAGYVGQVHFTSIDTQAGLPGDYQFLAGDKGIHTFTFTLKITGSQTITVTDGSISGTTSTITVNAGSAVSLSVSAPSSVTAGAAFSVTVTAKDAYGNVATGYTGTVAITSSDNTAVLPSSSGLTNGVGSFSVTLKTAGSQSITATDTVTLSITGSITVTVNTASASSFVVSGFPSPVTAGTAGTVTVTAKDAYGNVATGYVGTVHFTSSDVHAVLPANYQFTAGDAGVHQFSVTLKTAGTQSITATDTTTSSITGSQTGIQVTAGGSAKLGFTAGAGQSLTASTVSAVITVQLQDASGNPTSAGAGGVVVSLSTTSSNGRFYLDSARNNRITSVTIASGANSASFYYYDSSAGTPTLTASSGSLTPATTTFTINSYQLVFSDGDSQTVVAGTVSAQIRVQRQNYDGGSYSPSSSLTVNLVSSSPTGVFHSDAGGTAVITSVTISSGSSHSSYFYYKDTAAGTPALKTSATTTGYTPATTTFTIKTPVLVFSSGGSQTLTTGTLSSQITVQRQDGSGNAYSPSTAITVNLASSSGGGTFYSNSGGTQVITTVTIASGSSSASFYYKDTTVGSPTLTASSTGYTPATTTFTVYAAGTKLVFTAGAGQSLTASTVSAVITVQLQDASGNPTSAGAGGVVVSLSTTSSNGRFYLDSARNNRITSVTIASGANSASFYYYDSSAGTPTLTASSGSLTPATTTFTINNYQLVFTDGTPQTLTVGTMSAQITIQRQDSSGNHYTSGSITVNLATTSSGGAFYATSTSTTPITTVSITSTHYSATFYYKDSTAGSPTLTVSTGTAGYTPATATFTITGPVSKLVFTAGISQSLFTNSVSSVITVQRQDAAGNGVTSGGSITVNLVSSSGGGRFYSNSGGTTVITSITIGSTASSASFYYADSSAGSPTLTASSGTLTPATTTFTITVNQVADGGFESSGSTWVSTGSAYASGHDNDDPIPLHSGSYYAEIDTTLQGTGTASGILTETFSSPIAISSIPNTAGSLSIWIYTTGYDPEGSAAIGYGSFQITLTASDGTQLTYWWGNSPATAPTPTATSKVINMGTLPGMFTVGQWIQFSINLPAVWSNQGLSTSTSLTSIIIQGNGYLSGGNQYGQEIFIDDVQIQ